jgi:apolipoprotein N-acyltransferase
MYDPAFPRTRVFVPAILSGLLLYLSYFPVNAGFLAWIALVPLLILVRANARPRRVYFAAFVGGLAFYVPAIQWMRVAHPAMYASWLFLAFCCALFLVMSIWLARRLDRIGLPFWLSVPTAFVAVEYFRSHFPTGYTWLEAVGLRHPIGFGWYLLGHTQHDYLYFIQISDITGVYGVSFVVALVNSVIWLNFSRVASARDWLRDTRPLPPMSVIPAIVAFGLLCATIGYGSITVGAPKKFAGGPNIALIQGNLPQDVKNEHGPEMVEHFGRLAVEAVRPSADTPRPDLVVWPETSFVLPWADYGPGVSPSGAPPDVQRRVNLARVFFEREMPYNWRTPTLFGLSTFQWEADGREWRYNSALLINQAGESVGRYDKIHLVPFGEYVPMGETFPFLSIFTPYEGDYSCKPGEMWTRFPLTVGDRTYHFACLICYEDSDATLARQYVRPGEPDVDFFVNISNDGWFNGTEEHEQHLAICRFRAVETRRSVVRAVNMGISAIIDPDGRVVALPGPTWGASKRVEAVVRGAVPIGTGTSLYSRFGDWLPVGCWIVILLGGFVRGFINRRRVNPAPAAG